MDRSQSPAWRGRCGRTTRGLARKQRSHCIRTLVLFNSMTPIGTCLLQKDKNTQSSLGCAGSGAGRAALASADANDGAHDDGRGAIGSRASHTRSNKPITPMTMAARSRSRRPARPPDIALCFFFCRCSDRFQCRFSADACAVVYAHKKRGLFTHMRVAIGICPGITAQFLPPSILLFLPRRRRPPPPP
jgi:hypothetical protein